jgi:GH24 family phage-related lysozyme (muramidase)
MTMRMSAAGRAKLTEPWEERILYVYDDKLAKVHVNGKWVQPEWQGGAVHGTLTIGIGHTDAAGPIKVAGLAPRIHQGMRLTDEQAEQIFADDLEPCEARVNRLLKVSVTQHQFDALADLDFNCPSASPHVIGLVNAGNWPGAERAMLQYVNSKGERMQGLVRRRNAEISWANVPDDPETEATTQVAPSETTVCPKGERTKPPKSMASSTSGTAGAATGAGGIWLAIRAFLDQFNDASAPIQTTKDNLTNLGVWDHLVTLAHSHEFALAAGIGFLILGAYVWYDRRQKLLNDHV